MVRRDLPGDFALQLAVALARPKEPLNLPLSVRLTPMTGSGCWYARTIASGPVSRSSRALEIARKSAMPTLKVASSGRG